MSETMPEGATADTAVEPEGAPEPAFTIDPAEWQATQDRLAQIADVVQPPTPPWQQPQGPPVPDPFADDYQAQFQAYIEHVNAPMRQWQEQQQLTAAEQQAKATLDTLAGQGDFDRDTAWARANQIILQNGGDPNKALEQAAKETRELESRIRAQAVEEYKQQLQGVAGQRGALPAGPGGAQTVATGGLGNVTNAVTHKFFGSTLG